MRTIKSTQQGISELLIKPTREELTIWPQKNYFSGGSKSNGSQADKILLARSRAASWIYICFIVRFASSLGMGMEISSYSDLILTHQKYVYPACHKFRHDSNHHFEHIFILNLLGPARLLELIEYKLDYTGAERT